MALSSCSGVAVRVFRGPLQSDEIVYSGLEQNRSEAALRNQPIRDFRLRVEGVRLSMGRQLTQQHDLFLTDGIDNAVDDRLRGAFLRARHTANRQQRDGCHAADERAVRPAMRVSHVSSVWIETQEMSAPAPIHRGRNRSRRDQSRAWITSASDGRGRLELTNFRNPLAEELF